MVKNPSDFCHSLPERIHRFPVPLLQIAGIAQFNEEFHRRFGFRPSSNLHPRFPLLQIHHPRHLLRFPSFPSFPSFPIEFDGRVLRVLRVVGHVHRGSSLPTAPLRRGNNRGDLPSPGSQRAAGRVVRRSRGVLGLFRGERSAAASQRGLGREFHAGGGSGNRGIGDAERPAGRFKRWSSDSVEPIRADRPSREHQSKFPGSPFWGGILFLDAGRTASRVSPFADRGFPVFHGIKRVLGRL